MLRPFKSFLNNLQKNAETFFGSATKQNSPDMNSNPDEEEEIPTDSMYNIDELDAIDPLALDDDLNNRNLDSIDINTFTPDNTSFDPSSDGQIILVDVNSLKSSFTISESFVSPIEIGPDTASNTDDVSKHCSNANIIDAKVSEQHSTNVKSSFGSICDEVEGARSDGSDSGLGLELCASLSEKSNEVATTRSNLKRRSDPSDVADQSCELKKTKRNIQFTGVTVYYFPRIQGFTCVPSQGGCTLGMGPQHYEEKTFTLSEHAAQKRLQMLEKNPKPSSNSMNSVLSNQTISITPLVDDRSRSSTDESESDDDNLSDNSESELDAEPAGFLQPVPVRYRRALLKAAGVRDIASYEKNECRDIRASREVCGCSCREYCDPDSCLCSQSGIKCQVDRARFPCGCSADGCANVYGRVEFNPKRVRTHFIHTIMRLELEKKQKKCDKQNTLQSYDGRLRLAETNNESNNSNNSTNNHNQTSLDRLVNYNPANNILYPQSAIQSSTNIILDPNDSQHSYGTTAMDNLNRINCAGQLVGTPFDLQYEYKSEYSSTDSTQPNFAMLYTNTGYYSTESESPITEYSSDKTFPTFGDQILHENENNHLNGNQISTSTLNNSTQIDSISICPEYDEPIINDTYYGINRAESSTTIGNNESKEVLEIDANASVVSTNLNAFLNYDQMPSSTEFNSDVIVDMADATTSDASTNTTNFQKYESDYANKLSQSYLQTKNSQIESKRIDHNQLAPEQANFKKQQEDSSRNKTS